MPTFGNTASLPDSKTEVKETVYLVVFVEPKCSKFTMTLTTGSNNESTGSFFGDFCAQNSVLRLTTEEARFYEPGIRKNVLQPTGNA